MTYSFTRESKALREWSNIVSRMESELNAIRNDEWSLSEVCEFCKNAIWDGEPLKKDATKVFWGFDEPHTMPSDARYDYFYRPTYLMVLALINAVLKHPELYDMVGMDDALFRGLNGCTGRMLKGHGYDGNSVLFENIALFIENGYFDFQIRYPDVSPLFVQMFKMSCRFVMDGLRPENTDCLSLNEQDVLKRTTSLIPYWFDGDYTPQPDHRLCVAYGSNMDTQQMHMRCPEAKLVGIGKLKDKKLVFHKYATVEDEANAVVPVAVWNISASDERSLDRYEGVGSGFYTKETCKVTLNTGSEVEGLIYIMSRIRKEPVSTEYMDRLKTAYRDLGLDHMIQTILIPAKEESLRKYSSQ